MSAEILGDLHPPDYTVLVIDDNPTNLKVITNYLKELGFEVLMARSGESGLQRTVHGWPDIILLDVMMPGIDGFETCSRLKADPRTADIPVIFMTALTEAEHKVKAFKVGGVDYVTKPIQHEEVLARLTTHLRIRNLTQNLQKANTDKDKFLSIVAHDLRGPFWPVLGNAELLMEMVEVFSPEDIKDMTSSIYRSARQVMDLLENLLKWSQIQLGRLSYAPQSLYLSPIAEQTINLLSARAIEKNITFSLQISSELMVYADENILDTVIRNLTANALKFTPHGGMVTLAAQETPPSVPPDSGGYVEVAVIDTGVGISEENIAKLFQVGEFHSTLGTAKEQGTGLGLILCKEMVERNSGRIWVESTLGKGTTVKFTLPMKEGSADE